jgi:hypothetical protein
MLFYSIPDSRREHRDSLQNQRAVKWFKKDFFIQRRAIYFSRTAIIAWQIMESSLRWSLIGIPTTMNCWRSDGTASGSFLVATNLYYNH